MAKQKKTDQAVDEAPYGWDLIAESDGRRIVRGVSKTEAEETRARVEANSTEKADVVPSEPRDWGEGKTIADIVAAPAPDSDEGEKAPPPDEPDK